MSSVYTQSLYGQPSYGGPSFSAPLPPPPPMMPSGYPQYQYQYHQPPAPVFLDPVAFRREFASRLSQLTVNSRPIIQELSLLAQDYSRYAETVAELIEGHIRRVSVDSLAITFFTRLRWIKGYNGDLWLSRLSFVHHVYVVFCTPEHKDCLSCPSSPVVGCRSLRSSRLIFLIIFPFRGLMTNHFYFWFSFSGTFMGEAACLLSPRCHLKKLL